LLCELLVEFLEAFCFREELGVTRRGVLGAIAYFVDLALRLRCGPVDFGLGIDGSVELRKSRRREQYRYAQRR
jgi:hypothetical protein